MLYTIKMFIIAILVSMTVVGCGSSDESSTYSSATIVNHNGSTLGETRNEAPINGLYIMYEFGTGENIGGIGFDSIVMLNDGEVLGLCGATVVNDLGVVGDCTLPNNEPVLPCPDTRDGTLPQSSDPSVCYYHGYFHCSEVNKCLDKPLNVTECGEVGSPQRIIINGS